MNQRSFIGLLVALVVLGLLVFLVQRDRSPTASAGAAIVPGLQAALNDVERVTVAKAGGETVATLERRADGWVIAEKGGYRADVAKLRQGLSALARSQGARDEDRKPRVLRQARRRGRRGLERGRSRRNGRPPRVRTSDR